MVAEVRVEYARRRVCETLRSWVRKGQVDLGQRLGVSIDMSAQMHKLRAENRELRRANEILKAASTFFAVELDRRDT